MFADGRFSQIRVLVASGLTTAAPLALLAATPLAQPKDGFTSSKRQFVERYGKLPLSFEANAGQADKSVKFLSRGSGYGIYLTGDEAVLALRRAGCKGAPASEVAAANTFSARPPQPRSEAGCVQGADVVRMRLAAASSSTAPPVGEEQLPGTANYFIGNDRDKWRTSVPTYAKVRYSRVYPGVDLVYYGKQRQLEYDFVVAPGADPTVIRLQFAGAKGLRLEADGNLAVSAEDEAMTFHKPTVYQEVDGKRRAVAGSYALLAGHMVAFHLGSYDSRRPLVIDPVLEYSTYVGGSGYDSAGAISVDGAGNVYLAGETTSNNFPATKGAIQTTNQASNSGPNAFVTKLNATGTALVYSTYLGGDYPAAASGLAVDRSGNAYVTGSGCVDFPVTKGAFQTTCKAVGEYGSNGFVAKLNPTGTELVYSTYLGGSGNEESNGDQANGIAVDGSGHAYVTGRTTSGDFPVTKGAFQTNSNPWANAFVTKLNPTGSALVYSTYLSGSGICYTATYCEGDVGYGLAVDDFGNAYVAGQAYSSDFPVTPGAFQTKNNTYAGNGPNAFITKLNPEGTDLVYSTYLGGIYFDGATAIAVDNSGEAYVTGLAQSANFPVTKGAYQTKNRQAPDVPNAFVTKFSADGSTLEYSTLLGGPNGDSAFALAIDSWGNAYVTGTAFSSNFPVTPGAFQPTNRGDSNAFLTMLNPAGSKLLYSTYLGGSRSDGASSLAMLADGRVFVAGTALSTDFPVTRGAFQTANPGSYSGFVTEFNLSGITTTTLASSADPGVAGTATKFTAEVAAADLSKVPTGSMVFKLDGKTTITKALSDGKAVFATSGLAVGKHTLVATYGGSASFSPSTSATLTETIKLPIASPPIFSPAEGKYTKAQPVTVTDNTKGAVIYFTINGTTPTVSSTKYTKPIEVSSTETIKAIAVAVGHLKSAVASATYTIEAPAATPSISPAGGIFNSAQTD